MNEPVADYTECPSCTHPAAYHCPFRGCRVITESNVKQHEPDILCECAG